MKVWILQRRLCVRCHERSHWASECPHGGLTANAVRDGHISAAFVEIQRAVRPVKPEFL